VGFIDASALAGYRGFVVFFDVARALEECTPGLHLREVDVAPEGEAWVLDV
jgi:hypothetical protein